MAVETVGFSPSQIIAKNSLLRLTFGERSDITGAFGIDPFGQWPAHMQALWGVLPTRAGVFPSTPANVTPMSNAATIDARIHADRTGVDVINAIAAIDDHFVELKKAELLSSAQVAVANSDLGALARDAAAKTEAARAAADTWWSKITTAITLGGTTLKWTLLAVVVIALAIAYSKGKR